MKEVLAKILEEGVVPVIRVSSAAEAFEVAKAIHDGGISVIEVTFTVPGAMDVIKEVSQKFGKEVLLGAGTVLDSETARAALLNGARFLVTPNLNLEVIKMAKRYSAVVIPGALTPTEILTAFKAGSDFVKVFPCAPVGGPSYIKSLKAPFPEIPLIASGGVNQQTVGDFILAGAEAVGIGANLVPPEAVHRREPGWIHELTRRYLNLVKQARNLRKPKNV